LYTSLVETHYNVYAYISEEEFNSNYRKIRNSIDQDSLSLLEATNILQQVISVVNNGHTEIDFPGASYASYAYDGGTLFPLEIAFENGQSLIRKNFSNDSEIGIGAEIVSINGVSMIDILDKIYLQISAERTYLKNAKIELYSFPRYYWQIFGPVDQFVVGIRAEGTVRYHEISSINALEEYEMKRSEVMNAEMKLDLFDKTAYLNPGDFSGDEHIYKRFIDSAFTCILDKNANHLIIDLRNNRGGNDAFSDHLVSYIANKPFKWTSKFTVKTSALLKDHTLNFNDTSQTYFKEIVEHRNGEIYEPALYFYQPQPEENRFKGTTYVLVNRQSHSQAAVTAAQIQDYGFGLIVGEETAESPSLFASQFQYELPNTKIAVKVAKGYITRVNGSTHPEGVIPDIQIDDHLLDEKDEILSILLERLQ
ncbi:MAG: peptidase S41, partial [Flavobacteriaceae bacterium]|nr:peptidase S41 [Flavobacteriaceae bacterium]